MSHPSTVADARAGLVARVALLTLAAGAALPGLHALVAPRGFFDGFPVGPADWVVLLPPYNEHLITDVGGFYLAFAVLFAWAARTLHPALVQPLCAAWALAATAHLAFHVTHLTGFGAADAVAQTASLALVLVLPGVAVAAVRRRPAAAATPAPSRALA
jgi:hypothetical protein